MDKLIGNWPKFAVDVGTHLGLPGRIFGVVILILLYPVLYAVSRRLIHATFDRLLGWVIKEDLNFNKHRLAKRLTLFFHPVDQKHQYGLYHAGGNSCF